MQREPNPLVGLGFAADCESRETNEGIEAIFIRRNLGSFAFLSRQNIGVNRTCMHPESILELYEIGTESEFQVISSFFAQWCLF
ncbi:unnamed protein product [Linum trigynum]|uniref:Uncharacterized protein n=1 Tax=Linum trigynum TaxID=586398 RepID=A0AAV2GQM7_9ROSI